jgi:SAM-dependent methyltransferase
MTDSCDFEPLDRLARLAWDWAPALCRPEHGCVDYHRSWSLVRLIELGGALPAGRDFFQRELGALVRAGARRVLVSGGADTGVTSLVVAAFRAMGGQPELVFVDRCETPCVQNLLLARELGLSAEVRPMDAAAIDCAPVDAVVAHSFLHLVPGPDRPGVLQAWARALKEGGRLLMSCRLSDDEADWVRAKDGASIEVRRRSLEQGARRLGYGDACAEVAATAARFWATSPGQAPALTPANLPRLLEAAGIEMVALSLEGDTGVAPGPLALTTRDGARRRRAEVVAIRR